MHNDDWDPLVDNPKPSVPYKRDKISLMDAVGETDYERKERMLIQLSKACLACTMCELGSKYLVRRRGESSIGRDPHLFSNYNPSDIMIIGINPNWTDLKYGKLMSDYVLDNELSKYGLTRHDYYVTNLVKCATDSTNPEDSQVQMCDPFLRIEIQLIKPKLIVAFGEMVYNKLCPDKNFGDSLGKLSNSVYNIKTYAIDHPSSCGLQIFEQHFGALCKLTLKMKSKQSTH